MWLSTDPLQEKYPNISTYAYCALNPVKFVDPDGEDIVFVLDRPAASEQGHIAVLIGNKTDGWKYISINGVAGKSSPLGLNSNPALGILLVDSKGETIKDLEKAIASANAIQPDASHAYNEYRVISSTTGEDASALSASIEAADVFWYQVAGPGHSCIDVVQAAFESIISGRDLDAKWYQIFDDNIPGGSDLIPKNWFDKLGERIESANGNGDEKSTKLRGSSITTVEKKVVETYPGEGLEPK